MKFILNKINPTGFIHIRIIGVALAFGIILVTFLSYMNRPPPVEVSVFPVTPPPVVQKYPFTIYFPKEFQCLDDIQCQKLAEAIYFEARGESKDGQVAVAHVIMNRVNSPYYPDTVTDVVDYRCQFSYRCDGSLKRGIHEKKAWNRAVEVAELVYTGEVPDPTNGADHYANPRKLKRQPRWMQVYDMVAVIGNHQFHRR